MKQSRAASNGQQRHRTAIATADNPVVATALAIAMRGPLGDGLLPRLIDAGCRAARPEAAHACPPSDPCTGSDAGDAWEAIGSIAAAGRGCCRRCQRPSEYFVCLFPRGRT